MKRAAFGYHRPGTVEEALAALAELATRARSWPAAQRRAETFGPDASILNTYHGARQRPARCDVEEER
jgi:hypothetical protein